MRLSSVKFCLVVAAAFTAVERSLCQSTATDEPEDPDVATPSFKDHTPDDPESFATWSDLGQNSSLSGSSPSSTVDYVGYVVVPTVLVFGLFGNSMTLMVMNCKDFRSRPSSLILRALAISDTSLILMLPFNKKFVIKLLGIDIRAFSTQSCKVFFWLWRTSKMTSSWLVVLLSLERFVAVVLALRAHQFITKRNTLLGIGLVYLGIGGFNAAWVYMCDGVVRNRCLPNIPSPGFEHVARPMIVAGCSLYAFIPALLIIIFNAGIIYRLISNSKERKALVRSDGQDRNVRTTVILLVVAVAFVVLVVPIAVSHVVSQFSNINLYQTNDPAMVVFREVTQVMEQLNYSINFFLYVLCCKQFRDHFTQMLCHPVQSLTRSASSSGSSSLGSLRYAGSKRDDSTRKAFKKKLKSDSSEGSSEEVPTP